MDTHPNLTEDEDARVKALAASVAEVLAEDRWIPHEAVRAWLLRIANGELNAAPPSPS